jgi:hypothetical protein
MLRGTLDVMSEVGRGSTFRLTLPPTIDARVSRALEQVVDSTVESDDAEAEETGDNGVARQPAQGPWDPAAREAGRPSAAG